MKLLLMDCECTTTFTGILRFNPGPAFYKKQSIEVIFEKPVAASLWKPKSSVYQYQKRTPVRDF